MSHRIRTLALLATLVAAPLCLNACDTAPKSTASREELSTHVQNVIRDAKAKDPGMEKWFKDSYGYAVMPDISQGAIVFGGAFGNGEVFEQGKMIGWCSVSSGTVGFSLGGGVTAQIIFLQDKATVDAFKKGVVALDAKATGYAVETGGSAKAKFDHGMAVFMFNPRGLMGDASIGGQGFTFVPLSAAK